MSAPNKKKAPTFDPLETPEGKQVRQRRAGHGSGIKNGVKPGKRAGGTANGKEPPPEPTADLEEIKPPFDCYFLTTGGHGKYFKQTDFGDWSPVNLEIVRRELCAHGVNKRTIDGKIVSLQDKMLRYIHGKCTISAAMPLAGYKASLRTVNGLKLLVTTSPRLAEPMVGDCSTISTMFKQFCGVGVDTWGETQFEVLKLWLARAFLQVHQGMALPGHCLVLAGPKAACKTMIQERIITALLGGRKAKAALVFVKDKDFTSDLAEAEHLYLADELVSSDYRTRMNLGEKIKSFVANRFHSVHGKGVNQMTLDPRWRITISLNDSPDRLSMLPPLDDEDIADKVILLRCHPVTRPDDDSASDAWIEQMISELPAFVHDALQQTVPVELRETEGVRFGFKAFRNPGLMAEMSDNESESTALAIIDKLLFWAHDAEAIEAKPHQIRSMLFEKAGDDGQMTRELQRLFSTESRMGQILSRIMVRHPLRVAKVPRWGNKRGWRIYPPETSEQPPQKQDGEGPSIQKSSEIGA